MRLDSLQPDFGLPLHLILLISIPSIVMFVWSCLALSAVFKKAGEPAWAAWVPVYNFMVLARIAGYKEPMGLLMIVAAPVMIILFALKIDERFRAPKGFAVLALLVPVWASILGWGKYRFHGAQANAYAQAPGYPGAAGYDAYGQPAPAQQSWDAATTDINQLFNQQSDATPTWGAQQAPAPAPAANGWPGPAAPQESTWAVPAQPGQPAAWGDASDSWSASAAVPADAWNAPQAAAPSAGANSDVWHAESSASWQPPAAESWRDIVVPPRPEAVPAAAATPAPAAPETSDYGVQPGAVRMIDDSEAIAAARAAMPAATPPLPVAAEEDGPVSPIIVPGPSGQLRGVVEDWDAPAPSEPVSAQASPTPTGLEWGLPDSSLELSNDVSAVAGVADAGAPRSALSSVSAGQDTGLTPLDNQPDEETEIAIRHRVQWALVMPTGAQVTLTGDRVLLGRKPSQDNGYEDAQVLPVPDTTRTVSKTHALLELVDGSWTITDLNSTNGVVLFAEDGGETELAANAAGTITERFLLGDAELRLSTN